MSAFPRPGCTLLKDVELADVDAGRTVASARLVEIDDDAQGETIFASQPDIDTSATALASFDRGHFTAAGKRQFKIAANGGW